MDGWLVSGGMFYAVNGFSGFEWSSFCAMRVPMVSKVGSQIKLFNLNTPRKRHPSCRTIRKTGAEEELPVSTRISPPYPAGYTQFPRSDALAAWDNSRVADHPGAIRRTYVK